MRVKLTCPVLEKHYSCNYVSNQKGLERLNLRKWIGFYKEYGAIGLVPRKNQSYSLDFKLKVLKAINKNLLSLRDSSIRFKIPDAPIMDQSQNLWSNKN